MRGLEYVTHTHTWGERGIEKVCGRYKVGATTGLTPTVLQGGEGKLRGWYRVQHTHTQLESKGGRGER